MLIIRGGKLLSAKGVLAAGDQFGNLCCGFFTIAVWNSNAFIDDDSRVILNGTVLGTINNNVNQCSGRMFGEIPINDGTTDMDCSNGNLELDPPVVFNTRLGVNNGANTLRIESTVVNGGGNFGKVRVGMVLQVAAGVYTFCRPLFLDSTYTFNGPVGSGQDYTFTYTRD